MLSVSFYLYYLKHSGFLLILSIKFASEWFKQHWWAHKHQHTLLHSSSWLSSLSIPKLSHRSHSSRLVSFGCFRTLHQRWNIHFNSRYVSLAERNAGALHIVIHSHRFPRRFLWCCNQRGFHWNWSFLWGNCIFCCLCFWSAILSFGLDW